MYRRMCLISLCLFVLAGTVFAELQELPAEPRPNNYRVGLQANQKEVHNRDFLGLTVRVYNDGAAAVKLNPIDAPPPQEPDNGAVLFDEPEDPVHRPKLVGFVRVIPLGHPKPKPDDVPEDVDAAQPPEVEPVRFPLPLFGRPVVMPHSTEILSRLKMLVVLPEKEGPQKPKEDVPAPAEIPLELGQPMPQQPPESKPDREEGDKKILKFIAPRPGEYLVEADITTIEGVQVARAQQVIRIGRHRPDPEKRILMDVYRKATETNKVVKEALKLDTKTSRMVDLNNRYLNAILRFLVGQRISIKNTTVESH